MLSMFFRRSRFFTSPIVVVVVFFLCGKNGNWVRKQSCNRWYLTLCNLCCINSVEQEFWHALNAHKINAVQITRRKSRRENTIKVSRSLNWEIISIANQHQHVCFTQSVLGKSLMCCDANTWNVCIFSFNKICMNAFSISQALNNSRLNGKLLRFVYNSVWSVGRLIGRSKAMLLKTRCPFIVITGRSFNTQLQ